MTTIQTETKVPVLKKLITHTHIFTDPIFVNRQLSMKPVNINIRQHTHARVKRQQTKQKHTTQKQTMQHNNIHRISTFKRHVNIDPTSYIKILGFKADSLAAREKNLQENKKYK